MAFESKVNSRMTPRSMVEQLEGESCPIAVYLNRIFSKKQISSSSCSICHLLNCGNQRFGMNYQDFCFGHIAFESKLELQGSKFIAV